MDSIIHTALLSYGFGSVAISWRAINKWTKAGGYVWVPVSIVGLLLKFIAAVIVGQFLTPFFLIKAIIILIKK